jgi:hypothetical protein
MTQNSRYFRAALLVTSALGSTALAMGTAHAQSASEAGGLEEIVVTAQKREQSL